MSADLALAKERCRRFPMRLVAGGGALERSAAVNLGPQSARGRYASFLDDDDWLFPDHVATLVGALRDAPGKRIAHSGVRCVRPGELGYETLHIFNRAFDHALLLAKNHVPMHAALLARSLYSKGCRFDGRLDIYEDWDLWIQISQRTGFVRVAR